MSANYTEEPAYGQQYNVSTGETFGNYLIDASSGGGFLIASGAASDYTIRNIGINGYYEGPGFIMQIRDRSSTGQSLVENIYMGDGASKAGDSFAHGPGGIFVGSANEHLGHLTFRNVNVQGFTNNGIYASNGPGRVTFERCFAKNNGVSSFRCRENGTIRNCVAYNDNTDYGWYHANNSFVEENGRCVWVWPGGGGRAQIYKSHFAAGTYGGRAVVGHNGGSITFNSGAYSGGTQGDVSTKSGVGGSPDLSPPAGVPMTAKQAAAGESGTGGSPAPSEPDPSVHRYGVALRGDGATVTDSDFIWETDGRPVNAVDGGSGSVSARFEPTPEAVDGVDITDLDGHPREVLPGDAPADGSDVVETAEGFPTKIDLHVHDCYLSDIIGPAVHIGSDEDDATAVVENVHIDGADYGVIADGCSVDVIGCEIDAYTPFGVVNGGSIHATDTNTGADANPTMGDRVPASVLEAAGGTAFRDLP